MDLTANELRPFRIPRLGGDRRLASEAADGRSPLVSQSQKQAAEHYGARIVPVVKRKATSSTHADLKKGRKCMSTPVDEIIDKMLIPSTSKKQPTDTNSETDSPRSGPRDGASSSDLTRERLKRYSESQECHLFASKGLMEALLEHKMKTGRIESHNQILHHLNFEPKPFTFSNADCPPAAAEPSLPAEKKADEDEEDDAAERRGPRTPPGSPPQPLVAAAAPTAARSPSARQSSVTSSASRSPSERGRSVGSNARRRASAPPDAGEEVLQRLAHMAGLAVDQLRQQLTPDILKTLRTVDQAVLVATVGTVLQSVAARAAVGGDAAQAPEVTSTQDPSAALCPSTSAQAIGEAEMDLESDDEAAAPPLPPTPPPPLPPDEPAAPLPPEELPPLPAALAPHYESAPVVYARATASTAAPSQLNVIHTLVQALAIPSSTACALPVVNACPVMRTDSARPLATLAEATGSVALPSVLQPNSHHAMVGPPLPYAPPRVPSPILLDRYGMPLPTPESLHMTRAPPPPRSFSPPPPPHCYPPGHRYPPMADAAPRPPPHLRRYRPYDDEDDYDHARLYSPPPPMPHRQRFPPPPPFLYRHSAHSGWRP